MNLRLATRADEPSIAALIDASIRGIGSRRYDEHQVESALQHLFGVDTQMIDDETYFVAEEAGRMVGAGGWSWRRTPFGGNQATAVRDADPRDPAVDPAVIRAFYVHPNWTRQGIGRMLLETSEQAAWIEGFRRFELVATLTGILLYEAAGYQEVEPVTITLPDGAVIKAVRMEKQAPFVQPGL